MLSMNRHSFVSLHSLLELDQLPQKRPEFKGVLSQKTEDAFGITYKTVKVCLLTQPSNGQPHKEFRTYFTTTEELLKLGDWLKEQGCTHVAEDRNRGVLETGV